MNTKIMGQLRAIGLVLIVLFLSLGQSYAQSTRNIQWASTNGLTTLAVDQFCPAMEGYWEYTPFNLMIVGITDLSAPTEFEDMNYAVYPLHIGSDINLYFYKKGVYQSLTVVNAAAQGPDRIRMERKASVLKFYYNDALFETVELDANTIYRPFVENFSSGTLSGMAAVATTNLVDPCSQYNEDSDTAIPPSEDNEPHNYVHSKVFNEHGDIVGETRVYLDKMGAAVQTQTKDYSTNEIIGKQLVYDAQGRNALISLSAPTDVDHIKYRPKFLRSQDSNAAYNYSDFDAPGKEDNPSKIKNFVGTIGRHYNVNGEYMVPTTEYPFSQIEYQ
ncbi:MAG: hypothetical protein AAFP19_20130 [Bacteroidota bacterium]